MESIDIKKASCISKHNTVYQNTASPPLHGSLVFIVLGRTRVFIENLSSYISGSLCVWGPNRCYLFKCILISTGLFLHLFPLVVFISWGLFEKICLWSLRFAAPAGSNKPQTCFLGSNSTFAAPSLRQRPHHYSHKQQKCLCSFCVGGISHSE